MRLPLIRFRPTLPILGQSLSCKKHLSSGEYRRVGSGCLVKDFLGRQSCRLGNSTSRRMKFGKLFCLNIGTPDTIQELGTNPIYVG